MDDSQGTQPSEPCSDSQYDLGAYPDTLYVHTIDFKDVGLVWFDQTRRSGGQAPAPEAPLAVVHAEVIEKDAEEAAAMQALGLPVGFGSISDQGRSQPSSTRRTAPQALGATWVVDGAPAAARSQFPEPAPPAVTTHEWVQALDPATGHFYYYCEALQATQWEPPAGAFRPTSAAWWLPQGTGTAGKGYEDAMEGVEEGSGAAAAASPYDLAVESYRAMHGLGGAEPAENPAPDSREKPKARVESTGLLPAIPAPDPRQHIRFSASISSSASDGEGNGDGEILDAEESAPMDADASAAEEEVPRRRRRARRCRAGGPPPSAGLPPSLHKYWLQRYSLFSRFDAGVSIDPGAWYSVTPEVVAWHHAKRAAAAAAAVSVTDERDTQKPGAAGGARVAVDAFGGVGGNAVQLAAAGLHAIAVEIDPGRAAAIAHNARVYGVGARVEAVCADFVAAAAGLRGDVALLSPPWGGPEYAKAEAFDVEDMGGCPHLGLTALLRLAFGPMGCRGVVAWLPRNSRLEQVHAAAGAVPEALGRGGCEVEVTRLNGVTKAITAYYGTAARRRRR